MPAHIYIVIELSKVANNISLISWLPGCCWLSKGGGGDRCGCHGNLEHVVRLFEATRAMNLSLLVMVTYLAGFVDLF